MKQACIYLNSTLKKEITGYLIEMATLRLMIEKIYYVENSGCDSSGAYNDSLKTNNFYIESWKDLFILIMLFKN